MCRINKLNTIKKVSGFTLIELMLVVMIIGILASIAYPSYQDYMTRTRRVEAQGLTLELTSNLERFFTENGRYDRDTGGTAVALPFNTSPKGGGNPIYTIAFSAGPTSTSFTLSATPQNNQAAADTRCAVVSLDEAGVKCILGGSKCSDSATAAVRDAVAKCW